MLALTIALSAVTVAGFVGTIALAARDGYARIPRRP